MKPNNNYIKDQNIYCTYGHNSKESESWKQTTLNGMKGRGNSITEGEEGGNHGDEEVEEDAMLLMIMLTESLHKPE